MAIPRHFNLEVSQRALEVIFKFYDRLPGFERKDFPGATFLLSLSMPIVILPIERIQKYIGNLTDSHMNDIIHDEKLAKAIKKTVNLSKKIHKEKFFTGLWQYASLKRGAFRI